MWGWKLPVVYGLRKAKMPKVYAKWGFSDLLEVRFGGSYGNCN